MSRDAPEKHKAYGPHHINHHLASSHDPDDPVGPVLQTPGVQNHPSDHLHLPARLSRCDPVPYLLSGSHLPRVLRTALDLHRGVLLHDWLQGVSPQRPGDHLQQGRHPEVKDKGREDAGRSCRSFRILLDASLHHQPEDELLPTAKQVLGDGRHPEYPHTLRAVAGHVQQLHESSRVLPLQSENSTEDQSPALLLLCGFPQPRSQHCRRRPMVVTPAGNQLNNRGSLQEDEFLQQWLAVQQFLHPSLCRFVS